MTDDLDDYYCWWWRDIDDEGVLTDDGIILRIRIIDDDQYDDVMTVLWPADGLQ